MIERLHLVDGTYELFRAHFSKRPEHLAADGTPAKATIGLAESLLALLDDPDERATHVAVAFDNPIRSFRNQLFAGYKTEEGVPDELLAQFDLAEELIAALGFTVWSMDEHEADDALATAARRFAAEVGQVRICSPDKDLGQCLEGTHVVQVMRAQQRVVDEAALRASRGFGPASVPDFLALVGDTADGIPGLAGWGEKSASAVLGAFEKLERIPADPTRWGLKLRGAEKLSATLEQERAPALLYRRLATLITDVPLAESLEQLAWTGAREGELARVSERLRTQRFVERLAKRNGRTR